MPAEIRSYSVDSLGLITSSETTRPGPRNMCIRPWLQGTYKLMHDEGPSKKHSTEDTAFALSRMFVSSRFLHAHRMSVLCLVPKGLYRHGPTTNKAHEMFTER